MNFAAESHVDRSIHGPEDFIQTNIVGAFRLLEAARAYWGGSRDRQEFRFLHISTDEVFGTLRAGDPAFDEQNQYQPNSPYSASKAAADHLMRAYHHTYGLPVLTTNCSNNYGPFHFPEKAHSSGHSQRHFRSGIAALRRWAANSRLALCKGSLQRYSAGVGCRPAGADLQYRRPERADES